MTTISNHIIFLALVITTFYPDAALAEVMDKEPSLYTILTMGLGGIIPPYILPKRFLGIGLLFSLAALLWFCAFFGEIYDHAVGPGILKEAGILYVILCHLFPIYLTILCYKKGVTYVRTITSPDSHPPL